MRTIIPLLATLCSLQAAAQRGAEIKGNKYVPPEERVTMINDSVRQVETYDGNTKSIMSRHFFIGQRPTGVWQEFSMGGVRAERDFSRTHYGPPPKYKNAAGDTTEIMTVVEVMPEFPGGEAALFKFLGSNTRYPEECADAGISGVVYLAGIVDETGDGRTMSIVRGADPFLDYEAWRVTDMMPNWTPGTQRGKPVPLDAAAVGLDAMSAPSVRAFPVPSSGGLTITSDAPMFSATILDLRGASVLDQGVAGTKAQIDLSALATGTYLLCVRSAAGVWMQLVVRE